MTPVLYDTYGILLQCVDPLGVACVLQYLAKPEVERDTALHKQPVVMQPNNIPFIIYK